MNLKHNIIFQLNGKGSFSDAAAVYFKEDRRKIITATDRITEHTINALSFQCYQNNKTEELYKMARDCAALDLNSCFEAGHDEILDKGKNVISEIFGVKHLNIVDLIARETQLKSPVVNTLTALVTPVALATLNQINDQRRFAAAQMCLYLKNEAMAENETIRQLMPAKTGTGRYGSRSSMASHSKPFNFLFLVQSLFKRAF